MDPESVAFQPREDFWRFQSEMLQVQQNQAELADRVARLERKQDDDSRLKNVWGTSSPFPSVLGGTPQQVPLQQPTAEHFSSFDDNSSNLIGNLQLDADDEPRRVGTTSRANSVRFDETANHGHWAHASRTSLDLIPRTGSGLGGHALSERSYSYKSDGRQSSAGHSVHSATSGRANSLTSYEPTTPTEPPGPAPGLFILGPVPSIIRCWLNTNFKHNTLLYAAVCTGSCKSFLDVHLVEQLGFQDQVTTSHDGVRKIRLSVYLPEAVRISASSRSSSPGPQLPSVTVFFTIIDEHDANPQGIQIFIGSDMLRAHNADVLFSSGQLTLYDDDRSKLQISLVRPEDERAFNSLSVSHGNTRVSSPFEMAGKSVLGIPVHGNVGDKPIIPAHKSDTTVPSSDEGGTDGRTSVEQRVCLDTDTSTQSEPSHRQDSSAGAATARPGPPPAMLSSWRRDTTEKTTAGSLDWANVGKTTTPTPSYQRRDTGIKVLRPAKAGTRTLSSSTLSSATGQSRFYDDGKKRSEDEPATSSPALVLKRSVSGEQGSESKIGVAKTRTANPVGGASAFAWLNNGGNPPACAHCTCLSVLRSPLSAACLPRLSCLSWAAGSGQPPRVTTASTKKRRIRTVTPAQTHDRSPPPPPAASVRPSASPPRFLPPHLPGEVLDASHDAASLSVRGEHPATGASSPSEAYANLSLDNGDPPMTRTPRASSPAKRLHSDMDDASTMDVDAPATATAATANTARPPRSARASSVDMADASPDAGAASPVHLPSFDEQAATVLAMLRDPLHDQQEGYAISEKWLGRVFARTSEHSGSPQEFGKDATQGPVGPVDNSDLVDSDATRDSLTDHRGDTFVPLRRDVVLEQTFEMLPTKAWDLVVSWYGLKPDTPMIRRYVQNTVPDKSSENLQWELYPPVLTIRKVRKASATTTEGANLAERIVASRTDDYQSFLQTAKKAVGIDPANKVRVWRIIKAIESGERMPQSLPQPQTSGMLTPDASPRGTSPAAVSSHRVPLDMDAASLKSLANGTERELVTGKDERSNEESNPSLTLDGAGLGQDQVIVLEEHDEKGEYISDTIKVAPQNKASTQTNKSLQSNPNSGRSTPAGGPLTRGRNRNGKVRGHVGLTNLGNTCYMNSALQCLRSVEELSLYFLSGKWKEEINKTNPIGFKGVIASSYSGVLDGIYSVTASSSFSPKQFKHTLGKANGLFSGYGQQDSQEFLSWLVDALHEDLNRIHDKPYRENPDSDDNTFRDPELIKELGETYRTNHRARNHSVSTDLFNGFYKNTMVCPDCAKVSITFDPYSQLTLQLPIEQSWRHTVTYVPLYGKIQQLEVDIDKNATIKTLKEYVGKRFGGVKANHLMASEIYSHKFYRHLDDNLAISEANITTRDDVYFFELEHVPSNWPAPKKKAKYRPMIMSHSSDEDMPASTSPLHDRVIIPVFHRGPSHSSYQRQSYTMALWPFFIVVTREEAKDYDTILRKVLAKVAQTTTRPILTELSGNSLAQSRPGSDVVLTTDEDVSPNNDPRVKDGSIEGEDIVEVTMTDVDTSAAQAVNQAEIPEVLRPGSFIDPEFRQLFEMKHTRRSNEVITTGWSTVDHSKTLEPISKRIPVPPTREDSEQSSPTGSRSSSSDEEDDSPQSGADADAAIEAANVSSDEDMPSIEREPMEQSRGGRKKSKKARKHERKLERKNKNNKPWKSKKGKVPEQPVYLDGPDDGTGGLIRMGEALVLEWDANAYDALFGGTSDEDSRGMDAMKSVDTFDDPEIKEKKARRIARKKNGITLDECFMETSKSEVLSEDNAWYCSRCKELRRATKTLDIWTVPDILIIHLKRFSGFRSFRDKIEDHIDFPVEGLDLSGKVGFPEGKDLTYDLFAVDNHYGGLGGGHYTATAQNFFDKQWYDYNDSIVSKCSSGEKAVTRNAYLLFYRRRSSSPLGPPSLQEIVQGEVNPDSDQDSENETRSRSPVAGNGSRLDDLSRNGSSTAGAVGAGVGALVGGGSALSAAGTHHGSEVGAGNLTDDDDEGFGDYDDGGFSGINASGGIDDVYGPSHTYDQPIWSFDNLKSSSPARDDSDVASDAPNLNSSDEEDLLTRIIEDFGDDNLGTNPLGSTTPIEDTPLGLGGRSTIPMEDIPPRLGGEGGDGEVTEIRIPVD